MFQKFTNAAKVGTKGWLDSMTANQQRTSFEDETVHSILQLLVESCVLEEMGGSSSTVRSLGSVHDERRAMLRRLWDLVLIQDDGGSATTTPFFPSSSSQFTNKQQASSEDAIEKLMLCMSLLQRQWDEKSDSNNQHRRAANTTITNDPSTTLHKLLTEECLLILRVLTCIMEGSNHGVVCGRLMRVLPDAHLVCWLLTAIPQQPDVCRMSAALFNDLCLYDSHTMIVLLGRSKSAMDRVVALIARCEQDAGITASSPPVSRDTCLHILGGIAAVLRSDTVADASPSRENDDEGTTLSLAGVLSFGGVCEELIRIMRQQGTISVQQDALGQTSLEIIYYILQGNPQATSLFIQMGLLAQVGQLMFRIPAAPTTTTTGKEGYSSLPPFIKNRPREDVPTVTEVVLSLMAKITLCCLCVATSLDETRDAPAARSTEGTSFLRSGGNAQRWALSRTAREQVTNQSCVAKNAVRLISLCGPILLAQQAVQLHPLKGASGLASFIADLVEIVTWLGEAGDSSMRKFGCDWLSAMDGVAIDSEAEIDNMSSSYSSCLQQSNASLQRCTALETIVILITSDTKENNISETLRGSCCRLTGSLLGCGSEGWGPTLLRYLVAHPPPSTPSDMSKSHVSRLVFQLLGSSLTKASIPSLGSNINNANNKTGRNGIQPPPARLDTVRSWVMALFAPSFLDQGGWRAVLESILPTSCQPMALLLAVEVYTQVVRDNVGFLNTTFRDVLLSRSMVVIRTAFEGDGSHANRCVDAVIAWLLLAENTFHQSVLDPDHALKRAIDYRSIPCKYVCWEDSVNPTLPTDDTTTTSSSPSPSRRRRGIGGGNHHHNTLHSIVSVLASHELVTVLSKEYSSDIAAILMGPLPLKDLSSFCEAHSRDSSMCVWVSVAGELVRALLQVDATVARQQGTLWVPRDICEAYHRLSVAAAASGCNSEPQTGDGGDVNSDDIAALQRELVKLTSHNRRLEESMARYREAANTQRKRLRVLLPRFEGNPSSAMEGKASIK